MIIFVLFCLNLHSCTNPDSWVSSGQLVRLASWQIKKKGGISFNNQLFLLPPSPLIRHKKINMIKEEEIINLKCTYNKKLSVICDYHTRMCESSRGDTTGGGRRCPPWSSEGGATIWLNNCQISLKTRLKNHLKS